MTNHSSLEAFARTSGFVVFERGVGDETEIGNVRPIA